MKSVILVALSLLLTGCLAAATIAPAAPLEAAYSLAPSSAPPVVIDSVQSTLAAEQLRLQRRYLDLQSTNAVRSLALQQTESARSGLAQETLISAHLAEVSARIAYSGTLSALAAQSTSHVIAATATAIAYSAQRDQAALADLHAQSTSRSADATATAGAIYAQAQQTAIISTVAAPYTATVQAQKLANTLRREKTGLILLQVVGWGAVIGLLAMEIVIIANKWNREATSQSIELAKNSLFRGSTNQNALAWNGVSYDSIPIVPPAEASAPQPVRPIPIYGVGHPAPQDQMHELSRRTLEIVRRSIQLYGPESSQIAGYRDTTSSGDTWTVAMNWLQSAGVELKRTRTGTTLVGSMTLENLVYDLETGKIK